jgi:addiction module HigA family antidote
MNTRDRPPIHPGEVLKTDFLQDMNITPYQLAKDIGIPRSRLTAILRGERAITPDTAVRLSRYFGLSGRYWINMQARYDYEIVRTKLDVELNRITPLAS